MVMSGLIEALNLGATLTNSGDYSKAIRTYLNVLTIDENNATAWFCLGVLYSCLLYTSDAADE